MFMPVSMNNTTIVLIPKKKHPGYISDLRPISQIISKMLANCLKTFLPNIISEVQSAFVLGCLMTNNIMIVS